MARKPKSERKPQRVDAAPAGRSWLLPLLIAAVAVAIVALSPQLWAPATDADLYISRHQRLERKRFDVQCHRKKVPNLLSPRP